MLTSTSVFDCWLGSSGNESMNKLRVPRPAIKGSESMSSTFWFESWLWSPAREGKPVSVVIGREVDDWLGPAESEANQESTLSAGDIASVNTLMEVETRF